jgi:hypothetical protein
MDTSLYGQGHWQEDLPEGNGAINKVEPLKAKNPPTKVRGFIFCIEPVSLKKPEKPF